MSTATDPRGTLPDINHVRGDSFELPAMLFQQEGVDLDITSAKTHLRDANKNSVYSWTSDTNITIAAGLLTHLQVSDTSAWPAGKLFYDVELTLADGRRKTLVKGFVYVTADQTYD